MMVMPSKLWRFEWSKEGIVGCILFKNSSKRSVISKTKESEVISERFANYLIRR